MPSAASIPPDALLVPGGGLPGGGLVPGPALLLSSLPLSSSALSSSSPLLSLLDRGDDAASEGYDAGVGSSKAVTRVAG